MSRRFRRQAKMSSRFHRITRAAACRDAGARCAGLPAEPWPNPARDPEMRIQQLENQLRQMTGQNEELQYRNRQLEDRLRQLQSGTPPRPAVSPPPSSPT